MLFLVAHRKICQPANHCSKTNRSCMLHSRHASFWLRPNDTNTTCPVNMTGAAFTFCVNHLTPVRHIVSTHCRGHRDTVLGLIFCPSARPFSPPLKRPLIGFFTSMMAPVLPPPALKASANRSSFPFPVK